MRTLQNARVDGLASHPAADAAAGLGYGIAANALAARLREVPAIIRGGVLVFRAPSFPFVVCVGVVLVIGYGRRNRGGDIAVIAGDVEMYISGRGHDRILISKVTHGKAKVAAAVDIGRRRGRLIDQAGFDGIEASA